MRDKVNLLAGQTRGLGYLTGNQRTKKVKRRERGAGCIWAKSYKTGGADALRDTELSRNNNPQNNRPQALNLKKSLG